MLVFLLFVLLTLALQFEATTLIPSMRNVQIWPGPFNLSQYTYIIKSQYSDFCKLLTSVSHLQNYSKELLRTSLPKAWGCSAFLFREKKSSSAHSFRTQWFKTKRPIATQVQLKKKILITFMSNLIATYLGLALWIYLSTKIMNSLKTVGFGSQL